LNIIVCAKVIPASSVIIELDPNAKTMVRKGVPHELDPAAASALEEALRLTEKNGGTVTVLTMGIADAVIGIRSALAMGAHSAIHVVDDAVAGSDTLGTAKVLAAVIKKENYDLVLCASESSDSYSGIVAGQLAYLLGIPPLTFAKEIKVDGKKVTIKRQSLTGYDSSPSRAASTSRATHSSRALWRRRKKRSKNIPPPTSGSVPIRSGRRARKKNFSVSAGRRRAKRERSSPTKAKAASRSPIFSPS
jgi:electron transfer flavoprotein alpha subunit